MMNKKFGFSLVISLILLAILMVVSIRYGAAQATMKTVYHAVFDYHASQLQQAVIHEIRLPRILGAALIGASLAGSGLIMQELTQNPLADSGLLGINAGAGFMLTISFIVLPKATPQQTAIFALIGAALSACLILAISMAKKTQKTATVVLAGMAISSCLVALSEGLSLMTQLKRDLAFWHFGGVAAITWTQLTQLGPWLIAGLIASLCLAPQLRLLQLGDELVLSLGRKTSVVRLLGFICVIILAGISVALVGSVAFVGLMVPHITRYLVGYDVRKVMPVTLLLGASLVVAADLISRTINPPQEIPFGIMIALIGVPFFIYLARKGASQA
ncbi:FecCD family ABC transporter permease [Latilactobacillus sakei]|uniref:FecCD family ABC transporter permease n=2 Tax=Latilactobacillus sakei TaxID=1599 RepID=UPI0025B2B726|nr:iron ABC transporter permease [Latilactobacillus sakei]MDN4010619.1 iron ABC transporter permease [Latilactobacillus sakei]